MACQVLYKIWVNLLPRRCKHSLLQFVEQKERKKVSCIQRSYHNRYESAILRKASLNGWPLADIQKPELGRVPTIPRTDAWLTVLKLHKPYLCSTATFFWESVILRHARQKVHMWPTPSKNHDPLRSFSGRQHFAWVVTIWRPRN